MNESIRLETPIELIKITSVNPLISRCQIKVCWVGDTPNRNRSIITKEVAKKLANSLPGSPIVGYYNEETGDFEEHNRLLAIKDGKLIMKDTTRPYGFVDLNAKVWFAKYKDKDGVEREYLVTEGYLWTGQYPECKRIVDKGNNQSMELSKENLDAFWTKDKNGKHQFFIINEAIIEKLCTLGDDCEPCFEGSNITAPTIQFSFEDGFKEQLFSMMNEIKDLLNKGGEDKVITRYAVAVGDALWNALYSHVEINYKNYAIESVCEEEGQLFSVLHSEEDKYYRLNFSVSENNEYNFESEVVELEGYVPETEPQFSLEEIEKYAKEKNEDKTDKDNSSKKDNTSEEDEKKCPECGKALDECTCKKKDEEDKKKYNLEEIPEYIELRNTYSALETSFNELKAQKEDLEERIKPLIDFKKKIEKKEKEDMIASFYMLSDELKKDVIENIDSYSLEDIESKLSVICVRNKVSFLDDKDNKDQEGQTVYTLNGDEDDDALMPAWIKAAMQVAKTMN